MRLFSSDYYHGSGANFDKFDFAFMGSGEGAQVHGWGVYLAKDIDTAEGYRNRMTSSDSMDSTLYENGFSKEDVIGAIQLVESHTIANILSLGEIIKYNDVYEHLQWVVEQSPEGCEPDSTVAIIYKDNTVHFFHDHFGYAFYTNPLPPWNPYGDNTPETCLLYVEYNHNWDGYWENTDEYRYLDYLKENLNGYESEGMLARVSVDDDAVLVDEDDVVTPEHPLYNQLLNAWNQLEHAPYDLEDKMDDYFIRTLTEYPSRHYYTSMIYPCMKNKDVKQFADWIRQHKWGDDDYTPDETKALEIAQGAVEWYDKYCRESDYIPENCHFRMYMKLLEDANEPKDISMALLNNGIDGITYDGNTDGECMVLFNLDKCQIVEKM